MFNSVPKSIIKKLFGEIILILKYAQMNKLDSITLDLIEKSPVLIRLCSIVLLHMGDERDIDFFADNVNQSIKI